MHLSLGFTISPPPAEAVGLLRMGEKGSGYVLRAVSNREVRWSTLG